MPFKNGNKLGKGRPVGGVSKLPAEAKDVLARAYTELGGLKGFIDWCKSSDERFGRGEVLDLLENWRGASA